MLVDDVPVEVARVVCGIAELGNPLRCNTNQRLVDLGSAASSASITDAADSSDSSARFLRRTLACRVRESGEPALWAVVGGLPDDPNRVKLRELPDRSAGVVVPLR